MRGSRPSLRARQMSPARRTKGAAKRGESALNGPPCEAYAGGLRIAKPHTDASISMARRTHEESENGVCMNWRAMIVGAAIVAAAAPMRASDRLALKVSPVVSFAPANLVVRATVEANAENRSIEIVAES